jgi:hypothetical protein
MRTLPLEFRLWPLYKNATDFRQSIHAPEGIMKLLRAAIPLVMVVGYCTCPATKIVAEETKTSVQDLMSEFDKDPKGTRERFLKKEFQFEVTLSSIDFLEDGKKWAMVKGGPNGGKTLKSGIFLHLKKHFRVGDKIEVKGKLKSAVWTETSKRLFFDPCSVEKEIDVKPPYFLATKFLSEYTASPKKMADAHVGKRVQLKGQVQFKADGGLVFCYLPRRDARGRIEKDIHGFDLLGRALLTVRFPDDTVRKLNPNRGTVIEIEGTVSEMKAGKILIVDAKILN